MKRSLFMALAGLLVLSSCDNSKTAEAVVGTGADWPGHGGAPDEIGYSRLEQISKDNIGQLGLAWSTDLPGEATLEATPVAVNGVLYFTGSYAAVYAVDGATGKLLWKYDPKTWKFNPEKMHYSFAANRGVAYADGRIFFGALDGRLIALDAKTGKELWTVETTTRDSAQTITGAPRTVNGKVIIGNAGADFGARGYVTAYDAATGKQVWRFYVVPGSPEENKGDPAMEQAAKTWSGEFWKTGTGGAVWDGITFDPDLNQIYLGTGNAGPYDPEVRSPGGGDNLYTASIVALNADTGEYVWHYQINPRDAWDFDCDQGILLADLTIDGTPRKVLMQAPKNGFLYVLDRKTGKLISAGKIGKVTWADHIDLATGRPVETENARYDKHDIDIWPSPTGAHNWQAMSYSPSTGLVYIPYMQLGAHFSKGDPEPGDISIGGLSIGWAKDDEPQERTGALLAWDPVTQTERWKAPLDNVWNGGALSTAGDVVFQGAADGYFSAFDATSGERLWQFNAGLGIIAAPMSFEAGGKQYVSVLVGYGGSAAIGSNAMRVGWKYGAQPRRLLTFALGGTASIPPSPPADMSVTALDDPDIQIDPEDVKAGSALFFACAVCHGRDAVAASAPGPDLRESASALYEEDLWPILHDGTLLEKGMPRFEQFTREQVKQIHAYIRARARQTIAAQNAQSDKPSTDK